MHRRGRNVAGYIAIALVALVLWPQRFGGSMTYDITHGTSMQPTFRTGDLAVLRKAGSYHVGEVAAYRSPTLHTTVMHRIKTQTAKGYTFQGDNNNVVDPDVVTDKQLLGKLVVRVPKVGLGLSWLLKPINLLLAIGALFLLFSDSKNSKAVAPIAPVAAPGELAEPLVLRITALRLPQELPTAEVETAADLVQLARLHGIAVLRDDTTDYVMQGGMLFRHVRALEAAVSEPRRRTSPQGRDWVYERRPDADIVELASRRANVS
jgi:signal peptidase I